MKKSITLCTCFLLLGTMFSAQAKTEQAVEYSVDNSYKDIFYVHITDYYRYYSNFFSQGNYQDVYTARKWGATTPCGHEAHVEIRPTQETCPIQINFKVANCQSEPAKVSIDIINMLAATVTSPTNSISNITYSPPGTNCGFGKAPLRA